MSNNFIDINKINNHLSPQIIKDWLIDWLVFNVQWAIFQLYSGREHLKI